nr:kappa-type opioid receptor-like [Lytechinus pictus]
MLALRYILAVLIRSVLMVLGIPGNGLIIIVYCKKQRKTGTDAFILGLAIVDFIVCLSFPLKIYSYLTLQFTSDVLCKIMHFIVFWNTYLGEFLTAAITVDRYIAVCKPLKRRVSPKQAIIIISTFSILAAFCAIPSVTKSGIQKYGPAVSKCSYSYDNISFAQIISYCNDTLFYSCLVLITILYTLIWISVRHQARVRVEKLGGASSVSRNLKPLQASVMPSEAWGKEEGTKSENVTDGYKAPVQRNSSTEATQSGDAAGIQQDKSARIHTSDLLSVESNSSRGNSDSSGNHLAPPVRIDVLVSPGTTAKPSNPGAPIPVVRTNNKTTVMIFIITVIFFLSWIPTKIWDYYPNTKFTWVQTDPVRYNIFYVSLFAINLNQVINPFIYSFVNVQFRRECVRVMRHIRQCRFS